MKKFFLRSFGNGNGNGKHNLPLTSTNDSEAYWEHPLERRRSTDKAGTSPQSAKGLSSKSGRQIDDSERSNTGPKLRRTRSLSSTAFREQGQLNFYGLSDPSRSPDNNVSSGSKRQHEQSTRCQSPSRETQFKQKQMEMPSDCHNSGPVRPCSRTCYDSSGNSSTSSCTVSNRVVDRYIDGEQHQEINGSKNKCSQRNNGWRPPRAQCMPPSSTTASIKDNPRSYSSRETRSSLSRLLPGEMGEYGFENDSPRSIAKTVVDRLSQHHVVPKATSKDDDNIPITVTDIHSRSSSGCFDSNSDVATQPCFPTDEHCETVGRHIYKGCKRGETDEDIDRELQKKAKEAEERIMFLSEELEQERFVQYRKFDVSDLIQLVKNLTGERLTLALEISSIIQSRIADRTCAREELRQANAELESRTQKLEKEKIELQVGLEKELDRRSSDWSFKLEKYQLEEEGLRGRVRELAEQNVSLQREVSSLNKRETESRSTTANLEQNVLDLTARIDEKNEQNKYLQLNFSKLEEDYMGAIEGMDCVKKNFEEKEKECRELHRSITRLSRTCNEQEKTIDGLRERVGEQFGNSQPVGKFDKQFEKLKMEQMRLTGVELGLRKELESYRIEVDSLRHENINILTRLKDKGNESGAITTFKLDNEMSTRVYHLQNQGLVLVNESTQFCSKLLEFIKEKVGQVHPSNQRMEHIKNGLDGHFFLESETKILGFKHGIESLRTSLQKISTLLQAKSNPSSQCSSGVDNAIQLNSQYPEDGLRSELKAEILFSSLLREKLYSKELEVEQLQAELVSAVRGNDRLKCEVQNGMDSLSCLTHKMKDLELQLLKKNEDVSKLQNGVEESTRELETLRDILEKVSKERDMMWEEVNKYREKNMLVSSEVDVLKSKIETLEEDILLKEGQITILKDTLGSKSIDLLSTPNSTWDFQLQ